MVLAASMYLRGILILRARGWTGTERRALRATALACFSGGMATLFFALIWPLDALSEVSFAAHMAQHMVLIAVAAPLLAVAQPVPVLLAALPPAWRRAVAVTPDAMLRALAMPSIAFALHGALVWIWHAPFLFELALRVRWVHVLEHASMFGSALLFWSALRKSARNGGGDSGLAALWTFGTLMHTGLLGALITFSPRLLYVEYTHAGLGHLSPIEDQQLAGLLMWIPGSISYLAAGLWLVAAWMRDPAHSIHR